MLAEMVALWVLLSVGPNHAPKPIGLYNTREECLAAAGRIDPIKGDDIYCVPGRGEKEGDGA